MSQLTKGMSVHLATVLCVFARGEEAGVQEIGFGVTVAVAVGRRGGDVDRLDSGQQGVGRTGTSDGNAS